MEKIKPILNATNQDGDIFAVLAAASNELRSVGLKNEITEIKERVFKTKDYHEALSIIGEYVEFIYDEDDDDEHETCENCENEYIFAEGCGSFCSHDCESEYYGKDE